jgi:hypothetical protein
VVVVVVVVVVMVMVVVVYSPGKVMSITRIVDRESVVDNIMLCPKGHLHLLFVVNAEEC